MAFGSIPGYFFGLVGKSFVLFKRAVMFFVEDDEGGVLNRQEKGGARANDYGRLIISGYGAENILSNGGA